MLELSAKDGGSGKRDKFVGVHAAALGFGFEALFTNGDVA